MGRVENFVSGHRLSLIFSSRIPTSSAAHTTSASPAKLFERPFVALVYHPPVAQIVIYHSQQVVWNLFPHHRLDADISPRGIERIAYVNADQRAESLTLTSSFSWICSDVNHSLDSVHDGPAFPEYELHEVKEHTGENFVIAYR